MNKKLYALRKIAEDLAVKKCPMKAMMEDAAQEIPPAPAVAEEPGLPLEHMLKESPHETTVIKLTGDVDPEEVEKLIEGLGMPEEVAEKAEDAVEDIVGEKPEEEEGKEAEGEGKEAEGEGEDKKEEEDEEEEIEKEASARLEFALSEILWRE